MIAAAGAFVNGLARANTTAAVCRFSESAIKISVRTQCSEISAAEIRYWRAAQYGRRDSTVISNDI